MEKFAKTFNPCKCGISSKLFLTQHSSLEKSTLTNIDINRNHMSSIFHYNTLNSKGKDIEYNYFYKDLKKIVL